MIRVTISKEKNIRSRPSTAPSARHQETPKTTPIPRSRPRPRPRPISAAPMKSTEWVSQHNKTLQDKINHNQRHLFVNEKYQKKIRASPATANLVRMADRSLRTDSAKSERLYKQIIDTPVHDNDVVFTLLLRQCTANLNLEHFAKAKEIVDTASRQFPRLAASSSKLHCLRGGACLGLENYSQAFYETEMAIQLAPENYQAQFWHATSLFYLNEFAKSLQSLEIVIRNVKKHIASRMLAIECKRKCGLWKDIINDSLRMLNFQSLNGNIKSSIHCALAEGFMHVGELKKAECAASTAIAHNKSNRLAFQIRGEARYNLNQFKSSCADFHSFQTLSIEKRGGGKINSAAFTKWRTGGKQQRDQIHHGIHDTHFKLV